MKDFFPWPKKAREYPWYMLGYWFVIWFIWFGISSAWLLPNISQDGYVVRVHDSETDTSDWMSVGGQLKQHASTTAWFVGFWIILIGSIGWRHKWKLERDHPILLNLIGRAVQDGKMTRNRAEKLFEYFEKGNFTMDDIVHEVERHQSGQVPYEDE